MSVYLYSWNEYSKSAKALAEAMGIKRIRHHRSKFMPGPGKTIINWGASEFPFAQRAGVKVRNDPFKVSTAINKLWAFEKMQAAGVSLPPWTTDRELAEGWLRTNKTVVCRTILNGSEGRGIVIIQPGPLAQTPEAPLYVQYVPKKKEFRVHIVDGKVIDIQQKVRKRDAEGPVDFHVRNTANGFVFQRGGILVPGEAQDQALRAVRALGLDFGAVDIIWNEAQDKCYVLEVNTAPGIEGSTIIKYKEALLALCNL